jgi:hypothetical protein
MLGGVTCRLLVGVGGGQHRAGWAVRTVTAPCAARPLSGHAHRTGASKHHPRNHSRQFGAQDTVDSRSTGQAVGGDGTVIILTAAADGVGGFGLTGMRERVAVFGGSIDAAPRTGGGFRVQAVLPAAANQAVPA